MLDAPTLPQRNPLDWLLDNSGKLDKATQAGNINWEDHSQSDGWNFLQRRQERTAGGVAVGLLADLLPAAPAKDAATEQDQAQSHDQIAQIAGDTLASLPMVGTLAGGLARAALLVDPHRSQKENAAAFTINFAEGAVLNKLSRAAMPEGAFGSWFSQRLGTGLMAESVSHLCVGFGFGAIRAGFTPQTWSGQTGSFDLVQGLETVAQAGTTGALVNLPAGFIGLRVSKAASLALSDGVIGARTAATIAGVGSGYASGAVFGGLDAMLQGRGLPEILKSANQGGWIGAATGGLAGSLQKAWLFQKPKGAEPATGMPGVPEGGVVSWGSPELQSELRRATVASGMKEAVRPTQKSEAPREISNTQSEQLERASDQDSAWRQYRKVDYLPIEQPPLGRLSTRLEALPAFKQEHYYLDESKYPKDKIIVDDDYDKKVVDFHAYKVKGHQAEIHVPADYDNILFEVRQIRTAAEQPSALLDRLSTSSGQTLLNWWKSEQAAPLRALADDASAQQLQAAKAGIPTSGAVNTFLNSLSTGALREIRPILDARAQLAEHPYGSAALPEDIVQMLDENPDSQRVKFVSLLDEECYLNRQFRQEYPGFTKAAATAIESIGEIEFYKAARDPSLEPLRDVRRAFIHEQGHLDPETELFLAAASIEARQTDPFYSTRHSTDTMAENWADHRADFMMPDGDTFLALSQHAPLRTVAISESISKMLNIVDPGQLGAYADALQERIKYVDDYVRPKAQELARQQLNQGGPEVRLDALKVLAAVGDVTDVGTFEQSMLKGDEATQAVARQAINGLLQKSDANFPTLVKLALHGSPQLREMVSQRMLSARTSLDGRAYNYGRFFHLAGNPDNLPGLIDMIRYMPDRAGKSLVFAETARLLKDAPDSLVSVANKVWTEEPSLRPEALKYLVGTKSEPDHISDKAIRDVRTYLPDSDAIPLLLRLSTRDSEPGQAAQAMLKKYTISMIGHYVREMKRSGTAVPDLQKVYQVMNSSLGSLPGIH